MSLAITRRKFVTALSSAAAGLHLWPARLLASVASGLDKTPTKNENLTLWFEQPAKQWADALPLGNGRLGAMVFGGIRAERIALKNLNRPPRARFG